MSAGTRDWDASTYDRVSTPQRDWAMAVIERLALRGDETVLDAGCGTGRVSEILLRRLPRGRLLAVDGSAQMAEAARELLGDRARVIHADLLELELELDEELDAVFSSAVFHWIDDHARLFARLGAPGASSRRSAGGRATWPASTRWRRR